MQQPRRGKSVCHCINLRRIANSVSQIYDRHLVPTGLSVNQFSLLRNLGRLGTCSVSDLASAVGLERTTLVRTLQPLIDRELIADTAAPGRRNRALQLTWQGEAAIARGLPLWENAQEELESRLGEETILALENAVIQLDE